MKKKQKKFVFKPEFVGQTVFEIPEGFPLQWEKLHGIFNDDYIRLDSDFKINIDEGYVHFEPIHPLTLSDEFTLVVLS